MVTKVINYKLKTVNKTKKKLITKVFLNKFLINLLYHNKSIYHTSI